MKKIIASTLLLAVFGLSSSFAVAKGGGGGGGGAGGRSAANSNGIRSVDRDKGLERAAERRNVHSTKKRHSKKRTRPVK